MKKVFLVRHAKSSWENPELKDYDRPLKGRGVKDAYLISHWLNQNHERPDALYSSPATRALHTSMIFARNLNFPFSSINIDEQLYFCSPESLLNFIEKTDDSKSSIMIFSHNPTITDFVNMCQDQVISNVPTSGVVCLHYAIESWKDITLDAELLFFDYPKRHKINN
ncbi:MAG: histidine phosphatase family protein [Schleiferiaceae bacterium]|jgi:phosphohistidine phosphatase|nr:histidine phosphatase family protein [Schleiferiaceae bacterium]